MVIFSYLLYYLVIIPVSFLPFRLMYLFSDFLYLLFYHVFPYRKKVVLTNLRNSFPAKSEKEIREIAGKFYHHLCDLLLETIKSFTISEKQVRKRMVYKNPGIFESYFKKQKSLIVVTGHYNSWEWLAMVSPFYVKHRTLALFMPLSNKFFDKKVKDSRCRFGIEMYSVRETKDYFKKYKDELTITGFVGDQTPSNLKRCHWMNFLNQDTPVYFGTEKYATLYNYPVIFGKIEKKRRGFYEVEFSVISENPKEEAPFAITERHTKILEAQIKEKPEFWLWTHKRWKHKRQ